MTRKNSLYRIGVLDNFLFHWKDLFLLEHTKSGGNIMLQQFTPSAQRKMQCDNIHLMWGTTFTEENGFPQLTPNPDTDITGIELYPYDNRNKHKGYNWGIHFFRPDPTFMRAVTTNLERTTSAILDCKVVFAPDFSLYVDLPTPFINKQNLYRSRFAAAYWQRCGLNVIQTASWGDANSLKYAFEGLAENSVTAVCGIGHDFCRSAQELWKHAVFKLIELKKPSRLIIYGGKREAIPDFGLPVQYLEDYITRHFRNYGK